MNEQEEWLHYLDRWDRVVDAMRDRLPRQEVEEIRFHGVQEPFMGISWLLGGHEQGMFDLTPAEEDELWELASLMECDDEDVMNEWVRAKSTRNRPIRKVRPKHPLRGGGHGGRSDKPGKRLFPATWSDDEAIERTMDVARRPDRAVRLPSGEFLAHGERDGVLLAAVVSPDGEVLTAYPVSGPGVAQNPTDEFRGPAAERLRSLLHALLPGDHELRPVLDELLDVGEWPYVITGLRALQLPLTDQQRAELDDLTLLADVHEVD